MIYVAPEVHRAMRQVALDESRSASDVYVEAARAFLKARGVDVGREKARQAVPRAATTAELAAAIDQQGRRIEDLHAAVATMTGLPTRDAQPQAGTKAAEAMKVVLRIVREAGPEGVASRDLDAATHSAGIRSGAAEAARTVLRAAGLLRVNDRRWHTGDM